jgi:hypothetical protein
MAEHLTGDERARERAGPCSVRALVVWLGAILLGATLGVGPSAQESGERWWKGNTHTHTLNSDGDSPPGEVSHWYRDHGYDFLVLTDHNYYTIVEELQREFDREVGHRKKKPFLLIPGEEVTDLFEGEKKAPIHVNGLDTSRVIGPQGGESARAMLQRNVDGILEAGGVPSLNHPNFYWAVTAADMVATKNLRHFEVYNGHPSVNNFGGGEYQSLEAMWDTMLSTGKVMYGVAVDDAHDFQEWGPRQSNPGRGWVMVRAAELSCSAIRKAFEEGDFYSSTGVELETVDLSGGTLRVRIRADDSTAFTTTFIGRDSQVLAKSGELESFYTLKATDLYVRARVLSSRGEYAWSQPLFRAARD